MDQISLLKVVQLKPLCRTNHPMVSVTKMELIVRLVKCRWHGGPGICVLCGNSKLQFEYFDDESITFPNNIICKHYRGGEIHVALDYSWETTIGPIRRCSICSPIDGNRRSRVAVEK